MCCSKAVNFKNSVHYVTSMSTTTIMKTQEITKKKKRPKFKGDYQFVLQLQCHTLNAPWSVRYFVF